MRPLTNEETEAVLGKLNKYIGENVKHLLKRPDGVYVFRFHHDRVFYVSQRVVKLASNVPRDNLKSFGTCIGKFTKTKKFRISITALPYLAPYATHKIWLKPSSEQQFLYGHSVFKSGLGRITEGAPQYQGVVIYNMADLPLGFGVTAKSTTDCRRADPMTVVAFNQTDLGEFLRDESGLL